MTAFSAIVTRPTDIDELPGIYSLLNNLVFIETAGTAERFAYFGINNWNSSNARKREPF